MRNLKRILSLAMASIMLVGMMAISASAVDFPDSDKIEHADAVESMVALGIIKGKDDGNFDPEGIVTRAEMAKMICVAMNGGKDPNLGSSGGIYPDTKGNWAAGYIDFCSNRGIVSGDDKGNFNPSKTVTGTEAAKMILIALGYNAETEGFVNSAKWDININVLASTVGLFDNVVINSSEGLTRDDAAQMLYDGMQVNMVKYEIVGIINGNGVSQAVEITPLRTILSDKFSMTTTKGVLVATGEYDLSATLGTGGGLASEDGFVVAADNVNSVKQSAADTYFEYKDQDLTALMGQYVKVLSGKDGKVYGVYAEPKQNTVVTSTLSKVNVTTASTASTDGKVKIDGTEYKFSNTNKVYNGENASTYASINAMPSKKAMGDQVTFIDNTGDGKFDVALITPILAVSKVTYVSSTSFTANGSFKFEDVVAPEGLAKDDYVIRTSDYYADRNVFVKAEKISGEVAGTKGSAPVTEVSVDGTWYKSVTDATGASALSGDALALGSEYDLIAINGIVYRSDLVSAASKDILLVKAVASGQNAAGNTEATVMFTDGTADTVVLKGTVASSGANKLYTYKVKSGVYEITAIADAANQRAGYDHAVVDSVNGFDKATKKINSKSIASDAVILVKYDKDSSTNTNYAYKVMTGAELNKLSNDFKNSVKTTYLYNDGGFSDIKVAYMYVDGTQVGHAMMSGITSSTEVGYVTSGSFLESKDDVTYTTFKVWNGDKEVTLKDENQGVYAAGDVLTYDVDADGFITVIDGNTAPVAITAIDESQKRIAINGVSYDMDDDYVVLYVDTAAGEGVNSGSLEKAANPETDVWINNAKVILANGDVKYIIIDTVKNEWDGAGVTVTGTVTATYNAATSLWTLTGNTETKAITVAASGVLTTVNAATDGAAVNAIKGVVGAKLTLGTAITGTIAAGSSNFYTGTAGSATETVTPDITQFIWTANTKDATTPGWLHA